jgi:8-oxo-dGTP pyrophosphatase MutT (NUDIX family)
MDISVFVKDVKLNIRSAVIIETESGYIFDRDKLEGYYYVVGGRVKINETSENAAKREIWEEFGIKLGEIKLNAIMESFFYCDNKKYHEICFYYKYKIDGKVNLPDNYFIFTKEEIKSKDIQPKIIYDIIDSGDESIMHLVLNE